MGDAWTTDLVGDTRFPLTRLSVLVRAQVSDAEVRREALSVLFGAYWKPLYAFLRARGVRNEAAKDVVQGFCASVIEKGTLTRFDPARGRFRTYLLTCFQSYAREEAQKERARKRGGGRRRVPLSDGGSDPGIQVAARGPTPEQAYDRAWALAVMGRAFDRWKAALPAEGKASWGPLVDLLEREGYGSLPPLAELASRLGVTEARVRHFLHREAKARLRREILAEVREGTSNDQEAEEELAWLTKSLSL